MNLQTKKQRTANIAKMQLGVDEHISSAFYLCATFVLWLDVINIILLSIFISRLLTKIVAGADTAYFPNCIFAGTLAVIVTDDQMKTKT